jgi:glycine oxidase
MSEHVLVLGGGIIGLSCALEAARRGYRVTVIEPAAPGGQASGAAAGMLAPYSENTEQPDPFFRLCKESLERYPAWLGLIEEISGVPVEWIGSGSLNIAFHEADIAPLRTRLAWQNGLGAGAELVEGAALRKLEPLLSPDTAAAIYYPDESHVYAPQLVAALETACRKIGVHIADYAEGVRDVTLHGNSGVTVETDKKGAFSGDKLIVCAGAWTGSYERWFGFPVPIHPIRGQICAYEVPVGTVRHMVFSPQAYWAAKGNGTLVCGASEDVAGFDTTVTERGIERLHRYGPRVFPFLAGKSPVHRWAGLRPATRDGWPLLGHAAGLPQAVIAAGHYRNGILLSPVTAAAACDLLEGGAGPVPLAAFAPDRFATGIKA